MPQIAVVLPLKARERYLGAGPKGSLESWAEVKWLEREEPLSEEETSDFIREAEGVITGWGRAVGRWQGC